MFRFFGRIRKEVMVKDAFRKYLVYAIGEVLLVMVGILLALQVNNWNEWRKDREREKEIITELSISLQQNIVEMEKDVARRMNWNHSSDIIINVMESGMDYADTLNIHFQNARLP